MRAERKKAKADGAVFYSIENDPQVWDIPDQRKALEKEGIPSIYFKKQQYLIPDIQSVKTRINEFIESIKR